MPAVDRNLLRLALYEMLDVEVPNEEWESVGGFLFGTLEHVPEPGESVDFGGWRFAAEEVDGRRVRTVRVSVVPFDTEGERAASRGEGADAADG